MKVCHRCLGLALLATIICFSLWNPALAVDPAEPAPQEPKPQKVKGPIQAPPYFIHTPPDKLDLCGEPVPLNLPFVAEMLDREFTIAVYDQAQMVMWLKRASRYFPYISKRLEEAGLPNDLKYLAVAESALLKRIRSVAGAAGLWQFIPGTGRRYGLRRNRWFDDRHNPEKSTQAAIAYLKNLYTKFGSWTLAMAAYNCGENRVEREMKEQGVSDYYHLYLPRETMRYVYRILSAKIILKDPGRYGYVLPKSHLYQPIPADRVTLKLRRPLHLRQLAMASGSTVRELKELNPEIRGYYLPRGTQAIKIPKGKGPQVSAKLQTLGPGPQPKNSEWVVKSGDTLSFIAKQNGVSIAALRRANGISGSRLMPGQRLIIPDK
ncbi:MAG: transglycosylase SLT domain-containing protein [Desulfarculaceae bacterium]